MYALAALSIASANSGMVIPDEAGGRYSAGMILTALKGLRQRAGYTQGQLAELLDVGQPTVQRWETGGREPGGATIRKLAEVLNVPVSALYGEAPATPDNEVVRVSDTPPRPWTMKADVPIYGTTLGADLEVATNGDRFSVETTIIEPTQVLGYLRRPPALERRADIYALYVVGASMEPRFRPGERVYVDPRRPPQIGDDVIVQIRDHHGMEDDAPQVSSSLIKTLVKRAPGGITVEQYNPPGRFVVDNADIFAIHRVVPTNELLGD